ncbi:hypothetical protein D9X30_4895 [Cupriavidus sp. U2]|uniref:hypothetical protein n=1 Tax=Cupriavidus sp. U2 TaxID=2920269 RepID=UPI00129EA90A|nr:hypothetical protein [Cupriavidus sp. U2]KAI3589312.1 hypothetical protein D9X30_4895 [Cupriavidus sp. U2]
MTELETRLAAMRQEYEKLPALVKMQGGKFFGEWLAFASAVQAEAAELRRLIAEG